MSFRIDCPVQAAWEFATLPEHNGAEFRLVLSLRDGRTLRGVCKEPSRGLIVMAHYSARDKKDRMVFIRCADVSAVKVEFGA